MLHWLLFLSPSGPVFFSRSRGCQKKFSEMVWHDEKIVQITFIFFFWGGGIKSWDQKKWPQSHSRTGVALSTILNQIEVKCVWLVRFPVSLSPANIFHQFPACRYLELCLNGFSYWEHILSGKSRKRRIVKKLQWKRIASPSSKESGFMPHSWYNLNVERIREKWFFQFTKKIFSQVSEWKFKPSPSNFFVWYSELIFA